MPAPSFPNFDALSIVPAADVATNGTLTFAYPAGKSAANYNSAAGAVVFTQASGPLGQGAGFTIAYGANIVVTYTGATTIRAGTRVWLQVPLNTYDDVPVQDVGAAFSQSAINAAINALVVRLNALQALLRAHGIEPK